MFILIPDITTDVNSFDDLSKYRHFFIKSTADITQTIHTLYIILFGH